MNDSLASPASRPRVTIWGAARAVTGSRHLVETPEQKILLDCGLSLERGPEFRERNRVFPFDPYSLDAVVLSHAHADHCGNLPGLIRQGYHGPIYCTPATADVLRPMLYDSARIQEEDAVYFNSVRRSGEPWQPPLYDRRDAEMVLRLVEKVPYAEARRITRDAELTFYDAGHVLGSASVRLRLDAAWGEKNLVFSGDLGRSGLPLLKQPQPLPRGDFVLCESTYGGLNHDPVEILYARLVKAVNRTLDQEGKVLIPAFSLGRSQMMSFVLRQLMREKRIPEQTIYVDSPLASQVKDLYHLHRDCLGPEVLAHLDATGDPFSESDGVHHIIDREESRDLANAPGPQIVIASSGTGEGGRVVHHLKGVVDDPRCLMVLVSYQPRGSLGWRLLEPGPTVRFANKDWRKWLDVIQLRGFSGHADHRELVGHLEPNAGQPVKVRLVHAEPEPAEILAEDLRRRGLTDVQVPELGESFEI